MPFIVTATHLINKIKKEQFFWIHLIYKHNETIPAVWHSLCFLLRWRCCSQLVVWAVTNKIKLLHPYTLALCHTTSVETGWASPSACLKPGSLVSYFCWWWRALEPWYDCKDFSFSILLSLGSLIMTGHSIQIELKHLASITSGGTVRWPHTTSCCIIWYPERTYCPLFPDLEEKHTSLTEQEATVERVCFFIEPHSALQDV